METVSDTPCIMFADELLAAYPDAKVILTLRHDADSWLASFQRMHAAFVRALRWSGPLPWLDAAFLGAFADILCWSADEWARLGGSRARDWRDRAAVRRGYERHNDYVRSVVPPERLLEFRTGDGWEPLCAFLGREVPAEPYPRINDGDSTLRDIQMLFVWRWAAVLQRGTRKVAPVVLGMVMGGAAVWAYTVHRSR